MEANEKRLNIAVVGGGVAGITAAWLLSKKHNVTLIERDDRLGGHTNTISVEEGDRAVAVDTGFIVCNSRNYPCFYRLLDEWGVQLRDSDMSFGFSCEKTGLGYVGPFFRDFIAYRRNLLNPRFWGLALSQRKFSRKAMRALNRGELQSKSLGEFLNELDMGSFFVDNYLLPLAASVWSSPDNGMLEFPAETFIRFFANHGMIQMRDFPTWQTVVGGSRTYVDQFSKKFSGSILIGTPVESVRRLTGGVQVMVKDSAPMSFDHIVMASHAEDSLRLLSDVTPREKSALTAWSYHRSMTVLHTDESVMPRERRLWASWNYRRPADAQPTDPVPITYFMNRLQGLDSKKDYLVSLNLRRPIRPEKVIYSVEYTHPAYTPDSISAQQKLRSLDGEGNTHFCGSYMGYGFHEDATSSAVEVARRLGVEW